MQRIMTVASYNVLHGLDVTASGALDLTAAAASIEGLGADVVALQEVDRTLARTGSVDQGAWLADRLGWQWVFAPALLGDPERSWVTPDGDDDGGPAYGVGILSRLPVVEWRFRLLPGGGDGQRRRRPTSASRPGWDREPRVALTATVLTAAGPLPVTTTHLSYLPWRGMRQLRETGRITADSQRAILLGDLNLTPGAVRAALPGWTLGAAPPTYPAWQPRLPIDHIASRGVALGEVRAVKGTSDHLAIVTDVLEA